MNTVLKECNIIFTICDFNYLEKAIVMLKSLNLENSIMKYIILSEKINYNEEYYDLEESLKLNYSIAVVGYEKLNLDIEDLSLKYDVIEFATCLKPFVFDYLFKSIDNVNLIHYIDPDIYFISNNYIESINTKVIDSPLIYATPHQINLKIDQKDPLSYTPGSMLNILNVGYANFGYISMNKFNKDFLEDFKSLVEYYCYSDLALGMFTDQKIGNFLFLRYKNRVKYVNNLGCNYAYWNMNERSLSINKSNQIVVSETEEELQFIHFSGFDKNLPRRLSKHTNYIITEQESILFSIVKRYLVDLNYVNISTQDLSLPLNKITTDKWFKFFVNKTTELRFSRSPNIDIKITTQFMIDNILIHPDLTNHFREVIYDISNLNIFLDWMHDKSVYDSRKKYFKNIYEYLIINKNNQIEGLSRNKYSDINVYGFYSNVSGVGEFANQLCLTLDSLDVSHNKIDVSNGIPFGGKPNKFNLWCVNADNFLRLKDLSRVDFQNSFNVGVFFWEIEFLPDYIVQACGFLDEVWVASNFMYETFKRMGIRNVVTMPLIVPESNFEIPENNNSLSKRNGRIRILTSFDYLSSFDRKNPLSVVQIFNDLCESHPDIELVIKSSNGDKFNHAYEKLLCEVGDNLRIIIIDRFLSKSEMHALYKESDIYISLHRAEGLGLNLIKALNYGLEIISTNYGGVTDFLTNENSYLVDFEMVPVASEIRDVFQYPLKGEWAQPNKFSAIKALEYILLNLEVGKKNGQNGQLKTDLNLWQVFLDEIMIRYKRGMY